MISRSNNIILEAFSMHPNKGTEVINSLWPYDMAYKGANKET
jgi:hypothetical protein